MEVLQEEIEERWDQEWLCETDKAWDAIHRCLTDGRLADDGTILGKCILGGLQLHSGGDYIVSYLTPDEVAAVAHDLDPIDEQWLRGRYASLAQHGYDGPMCDEDFSFTWHHLQELREFFRKTAEARRPVVFSVDQ